MEELHRELIKEALGVSDDEITPTMLEITKNICYTSNAEPSESKKDTIRRIQLALGYKKKV